MYMSTSMSSTADCCFDGVCVRVFVSSVHARGFVINYVHTIIRRIYMYIFTGTCIIIIPITNKLCCKRRIPCVFYPAFLWISSWGLLSIFHTLRAIKHLVRTMLITKLRNGVFWVLILKDRERESMSKHSPEYGVTYKIWSDIFEK